MKREKKKVEPVVAAPAPRSTESKITALVLGETYHVVTSQFDLYGILSEMYQHELVFKPFPYGGHKLVRYHSGITDAFDRDMAIGRYQIVSMQFAD